MLVNFAPRFGDRTRISFKNNTEPNKNNKVLLLSDLDGTWLCKDPQARQILDKGISELTRDCAKKGIDFIFGYVTARPLQRVLKENLPSPAWTITYNGGGIHEGLRESQNSSWVSINEQSGYNAVEVISAISDLNKRPEYKNLVIKKMGEVVGNPLADNCPFFQPICIATDSINLANGETAQLFDEKTYHPPKQIENFVEDLKTELSQKNMKFDIISPYLFRGEPYIVLDISTPNANKGDAVNFLIKELGIAPGNVIIAADGGNDIAMMNNDGRNVVVVGGDKKLREKVTQLNKDSIVIRPADEPSSLGVLNGVKAHLKEICNKIQRNKQQEISFSGLNRVV